MKGFILSAAMVVSALFLADSAYSLSKKQKILRQAPLLDVKLTEIYEDVEFKGWLLEGEVYLGTNRCAAEGLDAKLVAEFNSKSGQLIVEARIFGEQEIGRLCIALYDPQSAEVSIVLGVADGNMIVRNVNGFGNDLLLSKLLQEDFVLSSGSTTCTDLHEDKVCTLEIDPVSCSLLNKWNFQNSGGRENQKLIYYSASNLCEARANAELYACEQGITFTESNIRFQCKSSNCTGN